jgi:hypothetical protein
LCMMFVVSVYPVKIWPSIMDVFGVQYMDDGKLTSKNKIWFYNIDTDKCVFWWLEHYE